MAATTNGEDASAPQDDLTKRVPPGTVLPPRGLRHHIEKVAAYTARNGVAFEERIRAGGSANMGFIEKEDAYNAYYRWRIEEVLAGRGMDETSKDIARSGRTEVTFRGKEPPKPPPDWQFSARMPNISAQDMEIVKVTALFAAKNGRSWVTRLSQRESANYQFDFLRPQHSLNMYFSKLVEQYKDLLDGETVEGGAPQQKRIAELEKNIGDSASILERARKRAEYAKYEKKQNVEKEEKAEKDRIAFAQIDWHDFSVVATITFEPSDEQAEMPAPRSLNDMLSLSLEEKARMRIDPNRRIEEAVPTFEDWEEMYGQPQQFPAAQVPTPVPQNAHSPQPTAYEMPPPIGRMAAPTLEEERDRARAKAKAKANPSQQARVRTDYVPQAQARNKQHNTSMCPNCKQQIPNDEMEQHLRIEMLSPEWREQMAKNQHRSSTTNLSTVDVANNLKRLASQRSDLFDPVTGQALSDEEQARRKRAEMQAYDGISQMPNAAALGAMGQQAPGPFPPGTFPPGTERPDVQEQIRYLHDKYKR